MLVVACSDFEVGEHLFEVLLGEVDVCCSLCLCLVVVLVLVLVLWAGVGVLGAGASEEQALRELEICFRASHHGSDIAQSGVDSCELGLERSLVGSTARGELVAEGLELMALLRELRGDGS